MRRIATLLLSFVLSAAPLVSVSAESNPYAAPPSEYFGPTGMTVLGMQALMRSIDNEIYARDPRAKNVLGTLSLMEESIADWETKYPGDPWLPTSLLKLFRIYHDLNHAYPNIAKDMGYAQETYVLRWIDTKYADTPASLSAHLLLRPGACAKSQDAVAALVEPLANEMMLACIESNPTTQEDQMPSDDSTIPTVEPSLESTPEPSPNPNS